MSGIPRADANAYMREWRKTPAGRAAVSEQKKRERARRWALMDLATNHPEEFDRLFQRYLRDLD